MIGAVLRTVAASGHLPGWPGQALRGALNGLLLGTLSEDRLRALDERYYSGEDVYRTEEWNEIGLSAWERALVERELAPGGRVVVVACGGGREVPGLLRDAARVLLGPVMLSAFARTTTAASCA